MIPDLDLYFPNYGKVKYLIMYLLATCISSSVNFLYIPCIYIFSIGILFYFSVLSFMNLIFRLCGRIFLSYLLSFDLMMSLPPKYSNMSVSFLVLCFLTCLRNSL